MPAALQFVREHPLMWRVFAVGLALHVSARVSEELLLRFPLESGFLLTPGLLTGILLLSPRRHWPPYVVAYAVSAIVIGFAYGYSAQSALVRMVLTMAEALFVASRLASDTRWIRGETDQLRSWASFVLYGLILAPALGALVGGAIVVADRGAPYLEAFLVWWAAHAFAFCVMVPILLRLRIDQYWNLRRDGRVGEAAALLLGFAVVASAVFAQSSVLPLFLLTPFLIFILARVGFVGLVAGMAILAVLAVSTYFTQLGPFVALAPPNSWWGPARLNQGFLILLFVTLTLIAALFDERRRLQIQIEVLVGTDALTGLPNRRKFDECLRIEWQRSGRELTPLTLLLVDVDHFKQYNDTYGHAEGDKCLALVARTIADAVARPSDLCARFGGEEFTVVLPNTPSDGAHEIATRLCQAVRDVELRHQASPFEIVTVSVGAATVTPGPHRLDSVLFGAADAALYRAKAEGRNRIWTVDLDRRSGTGIPAAVVR